MGGNERFNEYNYKYIKIRIVLEWIAATIRTPTDDLFVHIKSYIDEATKVGKKKVGKWSQAGTFVLMGMVEGATGDMELKQTYHTSAEMQNLCEYNTIYFDHYLAYAMHYVVNWAGKHNRS